MTPDLVRVPCSKIYKAGDKRVLPVELAVIHWTASPPKAPGVADPTRMRAWLANTGVQSSTHFIILRDGRIFQAADLDERTWHAGGSAWIDPSGVKKGSVNLRSIGIDMENVGPVRRAPDGVGLMDWYGGAYRGDPPVKTAEGYFEPYTTAQGLALDELVRWLAHEIPALRDPRRWTGHENIMRGKLDPGPLFPWDYVRRAVIPAVN